MSQLYYVASEGITMSNLCGYGNHLACDMGTEGCQCPHHEAPEPPPEEGVDGGEASPDYTGL